jgi:hypothetical protein
MGGTKPYNPESAWTHVVHPSEYRVAFDSDDSDTVLVENTTPQPAEAVVTAPAPVVNVENAAEAVVTVPAPVVNVENAAKMAEIADIKARVDAQGERLARVGNTLQTCGETFKQVTHTFDEDDRAGALKKLRLRVNQLRTDAGLIENSLEKMLFALDQVHTAKNEKTVRALRKQSVKAISGMIEGPSGTEQVRVDAEKWMVEIDEYVSNSFPSSLSPSSSPQPSPLSLSGADTSGKDEDDSSSVKDDSKGLDDSSSSEEEEEEEQKLAPIFEEEEEEEEEEEDQQLVDVSVDRVTGARVLSMPLGAEGSSVHDISVSEAPSHTHNALHVRYTEKGQRQHAKHRDFVLRVPETHSTRRGTFEASYDDQSRLLRIRVARIPSRLELLQAHEQQQQQQQHHRQRQAYVRQQARLRQQQQLRQRQQAAYGNPFVGYQRGSFW